MKSNLITFLFLFASLFSLQAETDPSIERETKSPQQIDSLNMAIRLVDDYQWEEARATFNDYMERYGNEDIAKYYLAVCLMNTDEYAKASMHFQDLAWKKEFKFHDEVNYYLGLCFYMYNSKVGNELAKKQFQKITKDFDSGYQKAAESILEDWF